jgi:hypothetical protein
MAKIKGRDERVADTGAKPPGTVALTNLYRHQPILFHFRGGSVRLAPLETQQVERACLESPEVARLLAVGALAVHEPAETAPGGAAGKQPPATQSKPEEA